MKFESYLSGLFELQKFEENSGLKEMTDSIRSKYGLDEQDMALDFDDLAMAAGGILPPDGGKKPEKLPQRLADAISAVESRPIV